MMHLIHAVSDCYSIETYQSDNGRGFIFLVYINIFTLCVFPSTLMKLLLRYSTVN